MMLIGFILGVFATIAFSGMALVGILWWETAYVIDTEKGEG